MPLPKDVVTLRSFLDMVSYYSTYLPTVHARPMRTTKLIADEGCSVGLDHRMSGTFLPDQDFIKFRTDPKLPVVVASDASSYGGGAIISHTFPYGCEKPAAHAARSLTATEGNYSQIGRKLSLLCLQ
ncbi:unnamed protein product [Dicrocoelium dendriticum]|nr:unnamed protein product [Dicrocoelium dendriticum]